MDDVFSPLFLLSLLFPRVKLNVEDNKQGAGQAGGGREREEARWWK